MTNGSSDTMSEVYDNVPTNGKVPESGSLAINNSETSLKELAKSCLAVFLAWRKGRFVPGTEDEVCRNACYLQDGFMEALGDAMCALEPLRTEIFGK